MRALNASSAEVHAAQVASVFIYSTFGSVGLVGNSLLFAAILRNKGLQSRSSGLLACLALCEGVQSVLKLSSAAQLLRRLVGWDGMSWESCFFRDLAPDIVVTTACVWLIMAISPGMKTALMLQDKMLMMLPKGRKGGLKVDRCLMLRWPLVYHQWHRGSYVSVWVASAGLVGALHLAGAAVFPNPALTDYGLCYVTFVASEKMGGLILPVVHVSISVVVVAANVAAARLAGGLRREGESHQTLRRKIRYQQSIHVVSKCYIGSWMVTVVAAVWLTVFQPSSVSLQVTPEKLIVTIVMFLGNCVNFSSNFFIYYCRNPEYRKAVRKMLGRPSDSQLPTSTQKFKGAAIAFAT